MAHKLSIEELDTFETEIIIASSTAERKKLKVVVLFDNGMIHFNFVVSQYDANDRNNFLFHEKTNNLGTAINWYNELI